MRSHVWTSFSHEQIVQAKMYRITDSGQVFIRGCSNASWCCSEPLRPPPLYASKRIVILILFMLRLSPPTPQGMGGFWPGPYQKHHSNAEMFFFLTLASWHWWCRARWHCFQGWLKCGRSHSKKWSGRPCWTGRQYIQIQRRWSTSQAHSRCCASSSSTWLPEWQRSWSSTGSSCSRVTDGPDENLERFGGSLKKIWELHFDIWYWFCLYREYEYSCQ